MQETLFIILSLHELDVEPLVRKDLKLAELYFAECCFLLHLLPPLKICCVCFVGLATPLRLLTGKWRRELNCIKRRMSHTGQHCDGSVMWMSRKKKKHGLTERTGSRESTPLSCNALQKHTAPAMVTDRLSLCSDDYYHGNIIKSCMATIVSVPGWSEQ